MKKLLFLFTFVLLFFAIPQVVKMQTTTPPSNSIAPGASINMFVRDDCGHCKDAKEFLSEFTQKYPNVPITYYDLAEDKNVELFNQVAEKYNLVKGTPITLVRTTLIGGFGNAETTGSVFEDIIINGTESGKTFEEVLEGGATVYNGLSAGAVCTEESCEIEDVSYKITIPLIGSTIDVGAFSLTSMSLILGLVDGFNPCAMWVLIMFLLILSQLKSKKRMWQYAGLFILAEAIMYYLILNVWFTAWDFVQLNNIITPIVAILALGSGVYFMYKFFTFTPVCKVANLDQQKKMSDKVKNLAAKPLTLGVALGILGLAFSVNIFEFACSIGIPQTFTKILELNNLSFAGNQWYMLLYILMYMFDDVIVFGIALYSIEKIGVAHKYSKWTTLIGGVLMILLGLIMLLNPEILVF